MKTTRGDDVDGGRTSMIASQSVSKYISSLSFIVCVHPSVDQLNLEAAAGTGRIPGRVSPNLRDERAGGAEWGGGGGIFRVAFESLTHKFEYESYYEAKKDMKGFCCAGTVYVYRGNW